MLDDAVRSIWQRSEQLIVCRDESVGLEAVIAIDDTTLGVGLGGVRCATYPGERAAITEAQRLSAVMTLKSACAELAYGGAKSVILTPPPGTDRHELMLRFGEFVLRTGGAYLPGVDMGTTVDDLAAIGSVGADVSCAAEDPSPSTALGVAAAIRATVEHVDGTERLDGVTVLVQGAGHVGAALARDLATDGAAIVVADIDRERATRLAAEVGGIAIDADDVIDTECDVFAPCALARVLSSSTIPRLRCRMIVGAANDILADDRDAVRLAASGIIYVPDFVANAGGVIDIDARRHGHSDATLQADLLRIGERVSDLLVAASAAGSTPLAVAVARAHRRLVRARAERHSNHVAAIA